jgi:LysM repeat protein
MVKPSVVILPLSVSLFLFSCAPAAKTLIAPAPSSGEPNALAYIEKYKSLAISEMKRTGVPASITLAQGMIESDYGRSRLAREGNNHFGIKCHGDWTGPVMRHDDERRDECFRKYPGPEESFRDHSDFLVKGSRYAALFDLPLTDYKGWAHGLKRAGYATNPDYPSMLIGKIEENNLHYLDRGYSGIRRPETLNTEAGSRAVIPVATRGSESGGNDTGELSIAHSAGRVMEKNRIKYIIVREGETRESIEEEFQLLDWELLKYNELGADFSPVAGQLLYLQPKRERAEPGNETHLVKEGETLYSIAQEYGVKIGRLYEYNRMKAGEQPAAGQVIWLRKMKPVN